jgi:hypothetical protein
MTSRPNAAESVTSAPHPTADPLTLCNACDANAANPNDPAGYCDDCRTPSAPPVPRLTVERLYGLPPRR